MKKKTAVIVGFILLLSTTAFAQGHNVTKRLALGYSFSSVSVDKRSYGMSTFGLTLAGKIDLYHGFSRINNRDYSVTGLSIYMCKHTKQRLFPALSASLVRSRDRDDYAFNPAGAFALYLNLTRLKGFSVYAVPNFSIVSVNSKYGYSKAESFGGLFISINMDVSEVFSFYLEPEFTFDDRVNPSLELGIRCQFGKSAYRD